MYACVCVRCVCVCVCVCVTCVCVCCVCVCVCVYACVFVCQDGYHAQGDPSPPSRAIGMSLPPSSALVSLHPHFPPVLACPLTSSRALER